MQPSNPYKEKNISTLRLEDKNVAVSGFVISKSANSIIIDDGKAQITVICSNNHNINESSYIRAFGTLAYLENSLIIQAHFIQDLSKINKALHKKIKDILSK